MRVILERALVVGMCVPLQKKHLVTGDVSWEGSYLIPDPVDNHLTHPHIPVIPSRISVSSSLLAAISAAQPPAQQVSTGQDNNLQEQELALSAQPRPHNLTHASNGLLTAETREVSTVWGGCVRGRRDLWAWGRDLCVCGQGEFKCPHQVGNRRRGKGERTVQLLCE